MLEAGRGSVAVSVGRKPLPEPGGGKVDVGKRVDDSSSESEPSSGPESPGHESSPESVCSGGGGRAKKLW